MIVLVRIDIDYYMDKVVFTWTKSISTDCILVPVMLTLKDELE